MVDQHRRKRSTGGLYQRSSDNMWVAAVSLPSIGGKRRRKVVVRARKEDALRELRKLHVELEKRGDLGAPSPTLEAWCADWKVRYGRKRKPTNWTRDASTIDRYIVPVLGKIKLDKLTVANIHRMHAYITDPKPDGLGLSPTTANLAHRLLSTILAAAFAEEKVARNVAKVAGAPSIAIAHRTHLDNAQAKHLLRTLDPGDGSVSTDLAMMALSYFTGMRPAERIGLTRDMIDLDAGTITVAWQLQRIAFEHGCGGRVGDQWPCGRKKAGYCPKRAEVVPRTVEANRIEGGLWLTRPKTRAGWRTIPMVGILRETMRVYLETHEPGLHGLVFTRPQGGRGKGAVSGRPIDAAAYTRRWHELLTAAGFPGITPHSARHTCVTLLDEIGVPSSVRIQIAGHAGEAVNKAIYTHTSDKRVIEGMQALDAALDWR